MVKTRKEKVNVGNTTFIVKDGKIVGITREGSTFTTEDQQFQGSVNYAIIMASNNHKTALLDLVKRLSPEKDDCTYNAIMILKQCELTASLSDAVEIALSENCKEPVLV